MNDRQAALIAGAIASLEESGAVIYSPGYKRVDVVLANAERYLKWLSADQ